MGGVTEGAGVFRTPVGVRRVVFLAAAGAALAAAARWCASPWGIVHMTAAPVVLAYAVLLRPALLSRLRLRHIVYLAAPSALVVACQVALTRTSPHLRFHWTEVPVATCFLASMGLIVALLDHGVKKLVSIGLGLSGPASAPRRLYVLRALLRMAVVLAVAAPYMAGTLLTHSLRVLDDTDPNVQLGPACRAVRFTGADGGAVSGWYVPAAGGDSDATVVLVPGRMQWRASTLGYVEMVRRAGYNVLFFDFLGPTGTRGRVRGLGSTEAQAVLGAARYLKWCRPRQSRHVFALGVAEGAGAVAFAAARDRRIEAVILDNPFSGEGCILRRGIARLPGLLGPYVRRASLLFASMAIGRDLFGAGLEATVDGFAPRPFLLVQGESDSACSIEQARRFCESREAQGDLWLAPEARRDDARLRVWGTYSARVRYLFQLARRAPRVGRVGSG